MEKYGHRITYPYNISEHQHYAGDGHHFIGDGHEHDLSKALEARRRFLMIGGILLSVICGVGIIFLIITHILSRRKIKKMTTKPKKHIILRRRPNGAGGGGQANRNQSGFLMMT
uniref:Uncharacterized protein n=1 Tax=Clytia hemisphaerica TaxID=252671 RepID=A0A7M5X4H7_9CNID|eukprot:TCONS_00072509-protein